MKKTFLSLAAFLPVFWAWPARSESAFPVAGEVLHYSINWPSGLSLGEVTVRATRGGADPKAPDRWEFDFNLDAAIPGFQVSEHHHSTANNDLCSIEFDKDSVRGKKKAEDKTTFDSHQSTATRQTKNGGKSEISISSCAKDALTYLFALRQEALGE